jgi:hypothetical protein
MFRISALLMLMLAAGGASGVRAGSSPSVNRAATPNLSDAQIESDIRARLARSPKISLDKFTVKVQGGVATFEGKTNVIQHKGVATRMAHSAGARGVVNHIQISEEARRKAAQHLASGRAKAGSASVSTADPATPASTTPKKAAIVSPPH